MSIFKGKLDSANYLLADDVIRGVGLRTIDSIPSYWMLESGDGDDNYLWVDDSQNLRMHTSAPTAATRNSSGSIIAGAANAGASKALDNLGTTAVNADIILIDDINLAIGASSDMTLDWDGTDGEFDFLAANSILNFGAVSPSDLILHGATATRDIVWDASVNLFYALDNAKIGIGTGGAGTTDAWLVWDGVDLEFDFLAANYGVQFGATAGNDWTFHGATAGSDVMWDASGDVMYFSDATYLGFGDSIDMYLDYAAANTLSLLQTVGETGDFRFGVDDAGIDVHWFSDAAGDFWWWDASSDLVIFEDVGIRIDGANSTYQFKISTDALLMTATDHSSANIIWGTAGTNGLDITWQGASSGDHVKWVATGTWTFTDVPVTLTGADSSGTLLTVTGIDTTGNSDSILIDHAGTGYAINIDLNGATSDGINIEAYTNHTVPLIMLDGDTAGFLGAANVGMLTIQNDIALADVTSSALVIDVGTVKPIDAAEGYCFRIVDTSLVATSNNAYAAYIDTTANHGLTIETRAVAATNLQLLGVQSQIASMAIIDGSTGTGWDGADNVGMLHLVSDSIHIHTGATMLYVANSAQSIASAEGTLARFLNTGTARAGATMVEISAKDATEYGLKVTSGQSLFTHAVTASAGVQCAGVSRTPTADGTGTGAIADGTSVVIVTSGVDVNCWLTLPTPTPGNIVWVMTSADAAGFEVRTSTPASIALNGGSGAGAESAIPATATMLRFVCASATEWFGSMWDADGDEAKIEAAAAA